MIVDFTPPSFIKIRSINSKETFDFKIPIIIAVLIFKFTAKL